MQRATVRTIADRVQCSPSTVRKLADEGYIESRRDYNGWRVFPHPEQTAETIRRLLLGEVDGMQKAPGQIVSS
jgi:Mn-dependent DtxR family transcriptional regulator